MLRVAVSVSSRFTNTCAKSLELFPAGNSEASPTRGLREPDIGELHGGARELVDLTHPDLQLILAAAFALERGDRPGGRVAPHADEVLTGDARGARQFEIHPG